MGSARSRKKHRLLAWGTPHVYETVSVLHESRAIALGKCGLRARALNGLQHWASAGYAQGHSTATQRIYSAEGDGDPTRAEAAVRHRRRAVPIARRIGAEGGGSMPP